MITCTVRLRLHPLLNAARFHAPTSVLVGWRDVFGVIDDGMDIGGVIEMTVLFDGFDVVFIAVPAMHLSFEDVVVDEPVDT